ncbi:MAG: glycerol kinase GlpK [Lactobacillaceae bacterium]|jgi:glycerol kinase|nr:glycerol kinase GlpK [Lactobacillaceae bacterium]
MAITRPEYILAVDQGTTSTRVAVFNQNARRVTSTSVPITPISPHSGWFEQQPIDIWRTAQTAIAETMINAGIHVDDIKALGIANQRETTIIWNRHTGQPIYNAVVWSSTQSQPVAEQIQKAGHANLIKSKTGLPISAYFSATKIRWILDQVEGAQALAEAGDLIFGTVDSWLVWNLTDRQSHITDVSNAARTMLFNIHTLEWDAELLAIFNIPASMLPTVTKSSGELAVTNAMQFFGGQVPITAIIGDQNAGLIGQLGYKPGTVKTTIGAGTFLMMNTGDTPTESNNNLVSTIAYQIDDKPVYALEGSVFAAGSAIQWLHERLGVIKDMPDTWEAAELSTNHDEVYVVPAFSGLGAPYWDPHARGTAFGLTRGTDKNDFIKATVQSIAYQTADILQIMRLETKHPLEVIKADGTVSRNPYLMQFQADITNLPVERSLHEDTTPLGVAFLAGLAVGYWHSIDDLATLTTKGRTFVPAMPNEKRASLLAGWKNAVKATRFFANAMLNENQ